jgi:hypothetical protein
MEVNRMGEDAARALLSKEIATCAASGVLPLKYAYVGSAARTHAEYAKRSSYLNITRAIDCEIATLSAAQTSYDCMVDIGCDSGAHLASLLDRMPERMLKKEFRILLSDFSQELGEGARAFLSTKYDRVQFKRWDIETSTCAVMRIMGDRRRTCCLLLGGTIGNVENPFETLCNIRLSLPDESHFLISFLTISANPTQQEIATVTAPYETPEFLPHLLEPLRYVGIPTEGIATELSFDAHLMGVVAHAYLDDASRRAIAQLAARRSGPRKLRCFLSRRFDPETIRALTKRAGFEVVCEASDNAGHTVMLLAMDNRW